MEAQVVALCGQPHDDPSLQPHPGEDPAPRATTGLERVLRARDHYVLGVLQPGVAELEATLDRS